ncbi:MAG TPA: hypothetical protein VJ417_15210, partial [Candidatus Glassbacteria bacterium]|nr:hypothetical protein [Candidatus Glassbacteria bacterium]
MKQQSSLLPARLLIPVLSAIFITQSLAQAPRGTALPEGEVHTRITTSRIHRYKVAVASLPVESASLADSADLARQLREIVITDLDYSLRFDLINRRLDELSVAALASAKGAVDFKGWQGTGAEYLVAGSFFDSERGMSAEIRVYDLSLEDLVFIKNYAVASPQMRRSAHKISDDVVLNVTGERGVASTRVAFIRDVAKQVSEVFICDYDGYGVQRVTNEKTISKLPSWNPNGTRIQFTSFGNLPTDPDLYSLDLTTSTVSLLYAAQGVDMAASWCERNGFLAFSSGVSGNQEIYFLRPGETTPNRLTFSYAMDIEPTWSPGGDEIAFTSTRA